MSIRAVLTGVLVMAMTTGARAGDVVRQQDLFRYAFSMEGWVGASQTNTNGEMHCLAERRAGGPSRLFLSRVAARHAVSLQSPGWQISGREADVVLLVDEVPIGTWPARVANGNLVHVSLGDEAAEALAALRRGRVLEARINDGAQSGLFDLSGSRAVIDELGRCVAHFEDN